MVEGGEQCFFIFPSSRAAPRGPEEGLRLPGISLSPQTTQKEHGRGTIHFCQACPLTPQAHLLSRTLGCRGHQGPCAQGLSVLCGSLEEVAFMRVQQEEAG